MNKEADQAKIKQLKQFQKAFQKLNQKYPDVMVFGDRNGDVCGYVSLTYTSIYQKDNNVKLTWEGKLIK